MKDAAPVIDATPQEIKDKNRHLPMTLMSTLKTHNLQSPDAGSVNIALTPNAGMVVAGVSTYSNQINVGSNIN